MTQNVSVSLSKHCLLVSKRYFKGKTPNTPHPNLRKEVRKMSRVRDLSNRTHLVKGYLNDSEYARFRRIAEATKNTNSRLIQWMLEGAIFVEFPPAEFGQVLTELRHIGINLNQLARLSHQCGYFDDREYRANAERLWQLDAKLTQIYLRCGAQMEETQQSEKEKRNAKK